MGLCRFQTAWIFLLFAGLAGGRFSAAAETAAHRTRFECRWCDEAIRIDGLANERAWSHADLIDDFYAPWKPTMPSASAATRARLLWDREYLYLFAELDDDDLFADIREHDGKTWLNDVFEFFFRPANDRPGYYEFQVNAAGTIMDMFLPGQNAGGFDKLVKDGDFHLDAKVVRRGSLNQHDDMDQGWSVEARIPWYDFLRTGGRPNTGEQWRFALCRYDYAKSRPHPELSTCAPLKNKSSANFHDLDGYATVTFMAADRDTAQRPAVIQRYEPLTTSRVVGSPEPPTPFVVQRAWPKLKLTWPIFVLNEPGSSRWFVIDQQSSYGKAQLHRTKDGLESGELETLLELDGVAYSIACHPQFAENGFIYVGWNGPLSKASERKSKVTRYTIGRTPPYQFEPDSAVSIIEWESNGHNGAAVTFGTDGMLYVTSGDGTSDSDTNLVGQGMDHLLAKLLRLDVDHPANGLRYSIPPDNPFRQLPNARPETWAYGFRNPWRITTDVRTGDIWVGNNGQDLWEQAFRVERGANYGWSVYEGGHVFYANRQLGPTPHVPPTVEHPHSEFRSLTGGVVYYGKKYPELTGAYIYGDYSTGKIWGVKVDRQKKIDWHRELADTNLQIAAFATDEQGEVVVVDHRGNQEGGLHTLELNPAAKSGSTDFPRKLSDTGLFASVAEHRVRPSLISYSVNSPLWSDGSYKERFIALPGAEPQIEVTATRGWKFPDLTVLVKSFALEFETGNPDSRKWVETRLLTKQDGEWFGYSYRWNDEQTDAELVANEGVDRKYTIRDGGQVREQVWHYPSRTECMVCHSRAANFVLGLTTLQMNKEHQYGEHVDNQLCVLERLGVLRVDWKTEVVSDLKRKLKDTGLSERQIRQNIEKLSSYSGQREAVTSTLLPKSPHLLERLVDPYDGQQPIDLRARSYLQANCAHCHVEAGGGNAQIDLEFATEASKRKLFDTKPLHHTYGIHEARLIAPGEPERSVLVHRVALRGPGQMPQLATSRVDEPAVEMLRRWILDMK